MAVRRRGSEPDREPDRGQRTAGQGISVAPMSFSSPALGDTPYDVPGRPAANLSMTEVRAQDLAVADFGAAGITLTWAADGRTLLMRSPTMPVQHVRVLIDDPGDGLTGRSEPHTGTSDDPHVMVLSPTWTRTSCRR